MTINGTQPPQPPSSNRGVNPTPEPEAWVHIDWFSGSYDTTGLMADYPDFQAITAAMLTQEGHVSKPASRNGYEGTRCGGVFYGRREDGSFREMSGRAARAYAESERDGIQRIKCTRLDIAYTWRTHEYDPDIARVIRDAGPQTGNNGGRPRKRTFYENSDGGSTIYIGAPASEVRMRVYDKYAEQQFSSDYVNLWRCELQLRGEKARAVWDAYHGAAHKPGYLLDIIAGQCERESILTDYIIGGSGIDLPKSEPNNKRVIERLHWLETQVAPTVRELCKMGYGDEIVELFQLRNWL